MVYRFGVDAGLVRANPATAVKAPMQRRSERMLPFESWAEVEAVADECGRWAPLVVFLADTGARPGEAVRVEHRHVHPPTVELPGSKTAGSWRTVHMTRRGVAAVENIPARSPPAASSTSTGGRSRGRTSGGRSGTPPSTWPAWRNARHTRYGTRSPIWSLRAGVPIATVAREMGHESTEQTFRVYGGWCAEMGEGAAALRESWASGTNRAQDTAQSP
jgi:integrase